MLKKKKSSSVDTQCFMEAVCPYWVLKILQQIVQIRRLLEETHIDFQ